MDIGFKDLKLQKTFIEGRDHARLGRNVFRSFLQKVQILADAESEVDLYAIKSLHFEKLSGDRQGQRSIRLNRQFRLVFNIQNTDDGHLVWIIEVVDYHRRQDAMKILKDAVAGLPIPPGLTLRDELLERGISQTAFSKQIGRPIQVVNEIINGKKTITAETAIAFEKVLGISAELWLKMEASYQISKARAVLSKKSRSRAKAAI